jgi:hypothetical protein
VAARLQLSRGMKPLLIALVLAPLVLQADAPKAARLGEPEYLSPLARQILKNRMKRHGSDLTQLSLTVTLLHHERSKLLATDIANEPRISRPIAGGEDDLNTALPERFFVLQDELRARAKAVAENAGKKDNKALGEEFGRMMQVCVDCHSAFLNREK